MIPNNQHKLTTLQAISWGCFFVFILVAFTPKSNASEESQFRQVWVTSDGTDAHPKRLCEFLLANKTQLVSKTPSAIIHATYYRLLNELSLNEKSPSPEVALYQTPHDYFVEVFSPSVKAMLATQNITEQRLTLAGLLSDAIIYKEYISTPLRDTLAKVVEAMEISEFAKNVEDKFDLYLYLAQDSATALFNYAKAVHLGMIPFKAPLFFRDIKPYAPNGYLNDASFYLLDAGAEPSSSADIAAVADQLGFELSEANESLKPVIIPTYKAGSAIIRLTEAEDYGRDIHEGDPKRH